MPDQVIALELTGGTFHVTLGAGGAITSDLHSGSFDAWLADGGDTGDPAGDREAWGRYEGAIDALESFVLAAAQYGIDVQDSRFRAALQTTLDAIGNHRL